MRGSRHRVGSAAGAGRLTLAQEQDARAMAQPYCFQQLRPPPRGQRDDVGATVCCNLWRIFLSDCRILGHVFVGSILSRDRTVPLETPCVESTVSAGTAG
jgi:hypothetical protein